MGGDKKYSSANNFFKINAPLQSFFFSKSSLLETFFFFTVLSSLVRKIFKLKLFFEKKISKVL